MTSRTQRTDNMNSSVYTFAGDTKREKKVYPGAEPLTLSMDDEEKTCRICLESELLHNFIRPCRCSGTVKFVHEECLKTWLASLGKELEGSKCELCHTKYIMKFIIRRRCLPRDSCKNGAAHCLFIPILVAVMLMLFLIVYLLAQKYFTSKTSGEQQIYTIALSITCLIAGVVISGLIINSVKEACYTSKLEEWKILSQSFPEDKNRNPSEDELRKLTEMRKKALVLPKAFKINGKKVLIPELKPIMTPISRGGRIVGFSPKFLTPTNHTRLQEFNRVDDTSFSLRHDEHHSQNSSICELIKK
ncbi:hypothetical protein SteCoe_15399 [Stentor coeruleus]|uniref:RING-CH-type domain-containing protein n=1 Tax=Stentor coeruleus TaxID=5963 RepID=A0A1R2C3Q2_9CILI|nr:hypothetical protein SteCoe_15399 [Stentor coeruleus]